MTTGEFIYHVYVHGNPVRGVVPASNGTETPLRTITGQWVLYVFDVFGKDHYYINNVGKKVEPNFYSTRTVGVIQETF